MRKLSLQIKSEAQKLGFDACGISPATILEKERTHYLNWIGKSFHADMQYLSRNLEKRLDPRLLEEGTISVISVLINYYPGIKQPEDTLLIAKYAYGEDYHLVIKKKLRILLDFIKTICPDARGRVFTDSAPILEKAWAQRAGLGWIGKNNCLISKKSGSFTLIGEILVNIKLEYDIPYTKEYCGTCTRCIEACPTGAIKTPYLLDANKCISWASIENKSDTPDSFKGKINNNIFGCDRCQNVCPWNNKIPINNVPEFEPDESIIKMTRADWEQLDKPTYNKLFKKSAIKRISFEKLRRNIRDAGLE